MKTNIFNELLWGKKRHNLTAKQRLGVPSSKLNTMSTFTEYTHVYMCMLFILGIWKKILNCAQLQNTTDSYIFFICKVRALEEMVLRFL